MSRQDQTIRYSVAVDGDKGLRSIADGLDAIAKSSSSAAPEAAALLEEFKELAANNALINGLVKEKAALQETGDALALAKIKLAELQTQLNATATPSAALEKSFSKQATTVATLDAAYNQHQATITKTGNALLAAGIDTDHLDTAQRNVAQSLAGAKAAASDLQGSMSNVAKETEAAAVEGTNAVSVFGELKSHLLEIAATLGVLAIAFKGVEFGAESVKNAAAVEQSLSRVQALAGGTAESFEEMDQAAEKAAIAVNTTTQNAAGGLAALVSQGLSAKDAIAALVPTLQLAKIANIDVGTAANEVAQALKSFNIPASEAQTVVDQLTAASHGAAGGLGAMANAAAQLAPDAKALGLSFTDTVSVLGLLESKGIDTEKSVRGLRTVFQELQNPTSDLRVQLLALGDGTGDFTKAIAALTSGTPRAQQALLSLSGPARSLIETLGQAGPGALAAFNAGLAQSSGVADRTAQAIDNNLLGAYSRFGNAIDLIGEKLATPLLKPFADELTKLAGQINAFSQSSDFAEIEADVKKFAEDAAKDIDQFIQGLDWNKFKTDAKAAFQSASDDLSTLAKSIGIVSTALGKISDTVGAGFHGLSTVIDGVVAGAAKGADGLVTLADKAGALTGTGKALQAQTESLHAALEAVGDEAGGQAGENFEKLKGNVADLAGAATDAGTAATAAAPPIAAIGDSAGQAGDGAKLLSDSLGLVPDYLDATATAATGAAPAIGEVSDAATHLGGGPLQDARKALDDATQALAALQSVAGATPEQLLAASAAVIDASRNLERLGQAANASADALKTAFATLKIQSQQSLQQTADAAKAAFDVIDKGSENTAQGLADRQNAFLAYAKSALAASASLDQGAQDTVQANLDSQASILGVTDALTDLEKQSATSAASLQSDNARTAASFDNVAQHAQHLSGNLSGGGGGGNAPPPLDAAAQKAQAAIDEMSSGGGSSLAELDNALQSTRQHFVDISDAAAKAFDTKFVGDFFNAFDSTGIGFTKVIQGMAEAAKQVNDELDGQRKQLDNLAAGYNDVGKASSEAFSGVGGLVNGDLASMQELSDEIANGTFQLGLLNASDLGPLKAALDAAIDRTKALQDAAKQAADDFKSLAQQTQDALDEADGNNQAIEDRRHAQALADLKDAATKANQLQSQAYRDAVENENKLHALKDKNIKAEQDAANPPSKPGAGPSKGDNNNDGGGNNGNFSGGLGGTFGGSRATTGPAPLSINIHLPTGGTFIGAGDAFPKQLAEQLAKALKPQLDGIAKRSQ